MIVPEEVTPEGVPDLARTTTPTPIRGRRRWAVGAALVVVLALVGGGLFVLLSGSEEDGYCATVRESNAELAALVGASGEEGGSAVATFTDSLAVLEGLSAEAPTEIAADWNTLILRLRGLRDALVSAGVDLSGDDVDLGVLQEADEEQLAAVTTAADELASVEADRASRAIEDHARQSCGVTLGSTDDGGSTDGADDDADDDPGDDAGQ